MNAAQLKAWLHQNANDDDDVTILVQMSASAMARIEAHLVLSRPSLRTLEIPTSEGRAMKNDGLGSIKGEGF